MSAVDQAQAAVWKADLEATSHLSRWESARESPTRAAAQPHLAKCSVRMVHWSHYSASMTQYFVCCYHWPPGAKPSRLSWSRRLDEDKEIRATIGPRRGGDRFR